MLDLVWRWFSVELSADREIDLGGAASRVALAIESNAPDVTLRAFTTVALVRTRGGRRGRQHPFGWLLQEKIR